MFSYMDMKRMPSSTGGILSSLSSPGGSAKGEASSSSSSSVQHTHTYYPPSDEPRQSKPPSMRGRLHLLMAVLTPLGLWHMLGEANHKRGGQFSAAVFLFSGLFFFGASALQHNVGFSPRGELLLQKLDHVGLAVFIVGSLVPTQMLLMRPASPNQAVGFFLASVAATLWVAYNVFVRFNTSLYHKFLTVMPILVFSQSFAPLMNDLELTMLATALVLSAAAAAAFRMEKPGKPGRGLHEVGHLFVVAAAVCVYVGNWSVVRRTCNLYSPEVSKDIQDLVKDQSQDLWDAGGDLWEATSSFAEAAAGFVDTVQDSITDTIQDATGINVGGVVGVGGEKMASQVQAAAYRHRRLRFR